MTRSGDKLSHRGRSLLLLGAVWFLVGLAILSDAHNADGAYPLALLPSWAQGTLWITAGTGAFVAPLAGAAEPRTKWAFAALLIPATARCLSYLISWAGHLFGAPLHGGDWIGALAWAFVVAFVIHEASTPVMPDSLMGGERKDDGR